MPAGTLAVVDGLGRAVDDDDGYPRASHADVPVLRSTAGREHDLAVDGDRVHAVDWVPATGNGNGTHPGDRRVLLVHGLGANTVTWESVGQAFADRLDATVTAIDLFGFGRTRARGAQATVGSNRRLVTSVLERMGPSMVIGNSMGATIGIGIAARRPDLLTSLVMVNPALPNPEPRHRATTHASHGAPRSWSPRSGATSWAPGHGSSAPNASSTPAWRRACPTSRASTRPCVAVWSNSRPSGTPTPRPRPPTSTPPGRCSSTCGAVSHDDLVEVADQLPMLLVHGEHDRLVGVASARAVAARHPVIDYFELDDVGHAPQLEAPERLVGIVQGWADRTRRPSPA